MSIETIEKGTRLCYKKNENGYAWVTVTEHKDGKLIYIREGKSITVPDTILGSRLFETLLEARENGSVLDSDYEENSVTRKINETPDSAAQAISLYDSEGYDKNGYNRDGYDRNGFNRRGYDRDGYNRDGYSRHGYDRDGFDRFGYDVKGYNRAGYGRDGYDREGYNEMGFSKFGYDREGYNPAGLNRFGKDRNGFNRLGYDEDGYDREGFNPRGYDRQGFNRDGYNKKGYDRFGFDVNGFNKNGFDRLGESWIGYAKKLNPGERKKIFKYECSNKGIYIACVDCGTEFLFTFSEYNKFTQKEYVLPKRCKKCREIKNKRINRSIEDKIKYEGLNEARKNKQAVKYTGREQFYRYYGPYQD